MPWCPDGEWLSLEKSRTRSNSASFTDTGLIPEGYRGAVGALESAGVIRGYPDGAFRPDRPLDRAEAAVTVARAEWVLTMRRAGAKQPFAIRGVTASEWRLPTRFTAETGSLLVGSARAAGGTLVAGLLQSGGGLALHYLVFGSAGSSALMSTARHHPAEAAALAWDFGRHHVNVWDRPSGAPARRLHLRLKAGCLSISNSTPQGVAVALVCASNGQRGPVMAEGWYLPSALGDTSARWNYVGPRMPLPVLVAILGGRYAGGLPSALPTG